MDIEYADQVISGSPFTVKAYDLGNISVEEISDGIIGRRSSFIGKLNEDLSFFHYLLVSLLFLKYYFCGFSFTV